MNLKALAASAALALGAAGAFAQDAAPIQLVLTPINASTSSVTFQRQVTGLFVDTFDFTPASFNGLVSASLRPIAGPINFFAAILNGEEFSFLPESGLTTFDFQSRVFANQPLELQVFGFAGDAQTLTEATATYGGTITAQALSAVPEPETYAFLLAGLAVLGVIRSRSAVPKQRASKELLARADRLRSPLQ